MSKKHVLIVDDAKDIVFLLTHSLKRLGPEYEVTTATDGATAVELIVTSHRPVLKVAMYRRISHSFSRRVIVRGRGSTRSILLGTSQTELVGEENSGLAGH